MTTTPHHIASGHRGAGRAGRSSLPQTTSAYCAVVLSGLFAGFLLTVLVLEGSVRSEGAAVYTQVRLIELKHLDDLASALLLPGLVAISVLILTSFRRGTARRWWAVAALLLLLATLVISVSISVPINTMQQEWSVALPPTNWADVRDRWQLAHLARTTTAGLAFLLLIAVPLRTATDRNTSTAEPERNPNVHQH